MRPFNIILAEDHPAFRKLVRLELDGTGDLEIIGEVEDGVQLLELLQLTAARHGYFRYFHAQSGWIGNSQDYKKPIRSNQSAFFDHAQKSGLS